MAERLTNKVALVTGGGGGIGSATVGLFAREWAAVAAVDFDRESADRAAAAADPSGERVLAIEGL